MENLEKIEMALFGLALSEPVFIRVVLEDGVHMYTTEEIDSVYYIKTLEEE